MKFLRNLLTSTGKFGDGEGGVPLSVKLACFFKDLPEFCRKNVAKKLQVEKIGKKPKNSEDNVKSRVTSNSMLP